MALELPPELGAVLGLLGLDWPQVNEDEVVRLADELGKLASAIDSVQMGADKALATLKEVYHGASADSLAELWGTVSKYSRFVVEACGATSTALHAAALVVEGCKGATATQLVATQGELAATSETGPFGSAAVLAAGKQIVSGVLEEAVSALGQALAQPVGDLVETVAKEVTGSGSGPSNSTGFGVDLSGLASCAQALRSHADDLDSHGALFRKTVEGLDVGQPGDMFGKLVIAAAEQIATTVGVEVLKRLLGSFQGTADGMDQVARNITGNEEAHTQQMQSMLTGQTSPSAPGPLSLAGGVSVGGPHHGGLAMVDGPRSGLDHADVGTGRGGEDFAGAAGVLVGHGATTGGAPGLLAPGLPAAAAGPAGLPQQRPPAAPRAVFAQHGSGQPLPGGDPGSAGGHRGTDPGGFGRGPVAQPSGALHQVPYGQAGGGGTPGQGGTGQVREAVAQQRSALRSQQDAPAEGPVEVLAAPSRDDATADV